MKHYIATIALLLGLAQGIENTGDSKEERSVWVPADPKYDSVNSKTCKTSSDCPGADMVCARHAWAYNKQYEAAQGCWHKSVCRGNASYLMFDGRQIQWFCGDDAATKVNGDFGDAKPYPLKLSKTKHWEAYAEACKTHEDCIARSGKKNQRCTAFIWDGTDDGKAFGSGTACYTWDKEVCPGKSWAIQNKNYVGTKFSHYTQMWCKNDVPNTEVNMVVGQDVEDDQYDQVRRRRDDLWDEKTGTWKNAGGGQDGVTQSDMASINRSMQTVIFRLDASKIATTAAAVIIGASMALY